MEGLDWRIFAFGSAAFAALTAIFGKIGVEGIGSNAATFVRTVVILFVSAILLSLLGEWEDPRKWSSRSVLFLVLSGVATGLSWLCYYRALKMAPASKVAPIDKLSVALVITLAAIFLGESLTMKVVVGGLLVVAGSIVLAL
jgi:bacterial/archaeal transporter family protein